jgi:hypothetical protein
MEYEIDKRILKLRDMVAHKAMYHDIETGKVFYSLDWQNILHLVDRGIAAMIEEEKAKNGDK